MTPGTWLVLAAIVAAAVLLCSSDRQPRAKTGHIHGGTRQVMATHEAGHVVAARALGATVKSARIVGAEPGVDWSGSRGNTPEQIATDVITFMHAGRVAAGTGRGCSGDQKAIREQLSYVPAKDRARVRRTALAQAERIVSSRRGEIRRVARQLNERGRL